MLKDVLFLTRADLEDEFKDTKPDKLTCRMFVCGCFLAFLKADAVFFLDEDSTWAIKMSSESIAREVGDLRQIIVDMNSPARRGC
jgi:hypothetical protein